MKVNVGTNKLKTRREGRDAGIDKKKKKKKKKKKQRGRKGDKVSVISLGANSGNGPGEFSPGLASSMGDRRG